MADSNTEYPERRAVRYEAGIQQAKRELTKIRWRLVSSNVLLAFLKVLKSARQFVDGTIVWRPGAILIAATMIGGVGIGVFQSPAFSAVGVAVAIVTLFVLLMFPSDAKVTERAERLKAEQAEMKSRAPAIAARRQELESELKAASDQFKNERLALEHRRNRLLAENWKGYSTWGPYDFLSFLERVFTELGYTVETRTSRYGIPRLVLSQRGKRISVNVNTFGYKARKTRNTIIEFIDWERNMKDDECDAVVVIGQNRITPSARHQVSQNPGRFVLVDEDSEAIRKLLLPQSLND